MIEKKMQLVDCTLDDPRAAFHHFHLLISLVILLGADLINSGAVDQDCTVH